MNERAKRFVKITIHWKNHLYTRASAEGPSVDWRASYKGQRARCFTPGPGKTIHAVAGGKVTNHRSIDAARDAAVDRMVAAANRREAARAAEKALDPTFPFTVFALRRGEVGKRQWFVGPDEPEAMTYQWEPYMWKAKLFRTLSEAHDLKLKFIKVRPNLGPIDVMGFTIKIGRVEG